MSNGNGFSNKQNWMNAEHESNLFSEVMIADRTRQHEVLLQINCKNERKNKDVVSRLRTVAVKVKYSSSILFWPPFLRLVVHSNYFLVLIGQELRL